MRVISGRARSLKLKTIEGDSTRPTTDRIKETLFNIISNDVYDSVFVDLFSGSGAIGIEALSRGAKHAYFVDSSVQCKKCICDNLKFTHLDSDATVICKDFKSALEELDRLGVQADIIFMDPPYNKGFEKEALKCLSSSNIVGNDTLIIVEASLQTDFGFLSQYGFELYKVKMYKTNMHVFITAVQP